MSSTPTTQISHEEIQNIIQTESLPPASLLLQILMDKNSISTRDLIDLVSPARSKHFENKVKIHILNNVQNGHCSEDCGYCAQRKDADEPIPKYAQKSDEEIIKEAKSAYESGAFRYCMVTSGRGLTNKSTERFSNLVQKIKSEYPMELCLSAGLIEKKEHAQQLQNAGLDKYNHNLNTSKSHYDTICSTHDYNDRLQTIKYLQDEGISMCSGVIAGMGEKSSDLVEVALTLREKKIHSIPVNFFLEVPDHAVENTTKLDPDYCLRVLSVFRLANPSSEIRMAAGREVHLANYQSDGLKVADSLFVSGYLNAHGSNIEETLQMIYSSGFSIDTKNSDLPNELETLIQKLPQKEKKAKLKMKSLKELRPFVK